jgi:hypothetical protein
VARAKNRTLSKEVYKERHHIIPRSIGGDNSKQNIVNLTAREHFICHWLLVKMTTSNARIKMVYALRLMRAEQKNQQRYNTIFTSRVYEYYKKEFIAAHIKRATGSKYTEEQKRNMSVAQKKSWQETWTDEMKARRNAAVAEANRRRVYTDEMRANRSKGLKGIKRSPEFCEMLSKRWKGKKRGPRTEAQKQHQSKLSRGPGNANAKTWQLTDPLGNVYVLKGTLREFCKTHDISTDSIRLLVQGKKEKIKGWKAILL